jgi:hypothetical protein
MVSVRLNQQGALRELLAIPTDFAAGIALPDSELLNLAGLDRSDFGAAEPPDDWRPPLYADELYSLGPRA